MNAHENWRMALSEDLLDLSERIELSAALMARHGKCDECRKRAQELRGAAGLCRAWAEHISRAPPTP
jgi:hypothetical protein